MASRLVQISVQAPFDLHLTAGFHAASRPGHAPDSYDGAVYTRVTESAGRPIVARASREAGDAGVSLQVEVLGDAVLAEEAERAATEVGLVLGVDAELEPFYRLGEDDPPLHRLCLELRGLHPPQVPSLFEALVTSITAQQVAAPAARAVRGALVEAYGTPVSWEGNDYHAFPAADALAEAGVAAIRRCGLSMRKAEYIWGIAQALREGSLDLEALRSLPDEEVESRLCRLRGVGHWTAHWLLIRALARPNGFPTGDLALARAVSRLYFQNRRLSEVELEEFSQRWAPYRSYASIYLMAASRMGMLGADGR